MKHRRAYYKILKRLAKAPLEELDRDSPEMVFYDELESEGYITSCRTMGQNIEDIEITLKGRLFMDDLFEDTWQYKLLCRMADGIIFTLGGCATILLQYIGKHLGL
jgi:hypothetical protein